MPLSLVDFDASPPLSTTASNVLLVLPSWKTISLITFYLASIRNKHAPPQYEAL